MDAFPGDSVHSFQHACIPTGNHELQCIYSSGIIYCEKCFNISDTPVCSICSDIKRNQGLICVVEDIRDVIAIENTGQYRGVYHVLGGVISPIDGIGPEKLRIDSLLMRLDSGTVNEVLLALKSTVEGETTSFYLFRKIREKNITVSNLARGVAVGDELEYTDEVTLGRSIMNRMPFPGSNP